MGIHGLNSFLNSTIPDSDGIKTIFVTELTDKVVAVDISIYLYQYSCAIKSSANEIYNADGEVITHIQAILSKALGLIRKKIKPVFVFDGKPPELKRNVADDRTEKKAKAKQGLKSVNKDIYALEMLLQDEPITIEDIQFHLMTIEKIKVLQDKKISKLKQTTSVTRNQMTDCKELLRILGIPVIESATEADSQCAYLVKNNLAYCVASEDMDILTFGTHKLVRKLSSKNQCELYNLDIILEDLDVTYLQFIDMCILLGCDYTCTIPAVGPKKIYNIIKTYGSIEEFINNDEKVKSGKIKIPSNFDYVGARREFTNPKVVEIDDLSWSIPNYVMLRSTLLEKYGYALDEIDKLTSMLSEGYYSVISGEKTMTEYKKNCSKYINAKKDMITMDCDDD